MAETAANPFENNALYQDICRALAFLTDQGVSAVIYGRNEQGEQFLLGDMTEDLTVEFVNFSMDCLGEKYRAIAEKRRLETAAKTATNVINA